jgi:DnaJ-class molecular chaperone
VSGTAHAGPDHYQVLGVARGATDLEIKSAFQKLAAEFHAAGKPTNADEVEEIRKIVTAYRVLADPAKRQEYDRYGRSLPSQELMAYFEEQDQAPKSPLGFWVGLAEMLGDVFFGFIRHG